MLYYPLMQSDPISTFLILADDLTGAADSAARACQAGLPARVCLTAASHPSVSLPLPPGVTAFTSESRFLSPEAAAQQVRRVLEPFAASSTDDRALLVYKKIDSTLRGNLGSELDAALTGLGIAHALVCPAFPAQGRGLQDGYLVAKNHPPQTGHLPTLLGAQSQAAIAQIHLQDVGRGATHLATCLTEAAQNAQLLVCDALTDQDLATICQAAATALPNVLYCGSAGLFGALVRGRQESEVRSQKSEVNFQLSTFKRFLFVVGSGSEMARRQIAFLRQAAGESLACVEVGGSTRDRDRIRSVSSLLLHLPKPSANLVLDSAEARLMAEHLAEIAAQQLEEAKPDLLVIVGGDTASTLLNRLHIQQLQIVRELLPGIPFTLAEDQDGKQLPVILKAGNFGDETTLQQIFQEKGFNRN